MMIVKIQAIARVLNVTLSAEVENLTLVANAMPIVRRALSVAMVNHNGAAIKA
jgi:hypothetical protein